MTKLHWDGVGEKVFETGVDHGVLYPIEDSGDYGDGVAWNGLTAFTESPSGAEPNDQYADNIKYVSIRSAEQFGGTLEAFTYPDEFLECDGVRVVNGVLVAGQGRRSFGFCYRTRVGNDVNERAGYKLHLVYGASANPSEKANTTVNDSPEASAFSWELSTTAVEVPDLEPSAKLTIPSLGVDPDALAALELILYGDTGVEPRLPLPEEVFSIFDGGVTEVRAVGANAPTYNSGTHVITLPSVTGIQWKINGVNKTAGAQPALTIGQVALVTAHPTAGYVVTGDDDWTYDY